MRRLASTCVLVSIAAAIGVCVSHVRGDELVGPPVPPPPTETAASKCKVLHLKIVGDLDNARLAKEFAGAASDLRADDVDLVVLEIGANRWRADVLAEMARSARDAGLVPPAGGNAGTVHRVRWIVWLNDPDDQRVGSGPLGLGVLAERCYTGSKVEVIHEPGEDVRELAPPPPAVDWDQIDQDLRAAVWSRLSQRGCDLLVAAAVPTPRQVLWVTEGATEDRVGPRLKVVDREPPGGSDGEGAERPRPLVMRPPGGDAGALRLRMSPQVLAGLGLVCGQARELGQILAAEHIVARTVSRKSIVSGLADARRRMQDGLAAIDAAREKLDHSLDEAERARGQDAARKRSRAGSSGVGLADDAMRRLLDVEALTGEYPELMRVMPPGQTTVGTTELRLSQAWVAAFQTRRQALTDLRNRAVRLAEPQGAR